MTQQDRNRREFARDFARFQESRRTCNYDKLVEYQRMGTPCTFTVAPELGKSPVELAPPYQVIFVGNELVVFRSLKTETEAVFAIWRLGGLREE